MFSFKWAFSFSSFTLIKRFFSSSSLSAIIVVSFTYLRLLMFLLIILIPACDSSSLAFLIMCSAYRLNNQGDSRQLYLTPFLILNQSVVPYRVLTAASWSTYRFLRRQAKWPSILISLRAFHHLLWSTVKSFSVANETEVDVLLEFPCFLYDPVNVNNLISDFSAFSKPSFDVGKFSVHIMLKPSMQDFKHDLTSMGDECNCLMVWTFFSTALLGIGIRIDLFQSCGHFWVFKICWHIECNTLIAQSFRVLNSSTVQGIPSHIPTLLSSVS